MTHPSDMAVLVERLRELLAKATPGPMSVETQVLENVEEGNEPAVYICHPGTVCDFSVLATMSPSIRVPLGQKQADATLIVEAINALPALLDALSTDQRTGQEVAGLVEQARRICAQHDPNKGYQYLEGQRDDYVPMTAVIAALQQSRSTPGAGEAVPTNLRVRVRTLLATLSADDFRNADIGAAYAEEARELVAALAASPVPVDASGVYREAVAYLYTSDAGDKELILDCNGEYARRLLEIGYTEMPLYAALTTPAPVAGNALDAVLVGGNHLASVLIRRLGPDFPEKWPPSMHPEEAIRTLCATDEYDIWCAWRAIMNTRNALHGQSAGKDDGGRE